MAQKLVPKRPTRQQVGRSSNRTSERHVYIYPNKFEIVSSAIIYFIAGLTRMEIVHTLEMA